MVCGLGARASTEDRGNRNPVFCVGVAPDSVCVRAHHHIHASMSIRASAFEAFV